MRLRVAVAMLAGLAAGLVGGGNAGWAFFGSSPEDDLREACIAALTEMQDRPSTLKVLGDAGMQIGPASQIEFMGWENPDRQMREMVMANTGTDRQAELVRMRLQLFADAEWQVAQMMIDYEAAPPPGLPWRRIAMCKAVGSDKDFPASIKASQVRIDGDTVMDRALERLRDLGG